MPLTESRTEFHLADGSDVSIKLAREKYTYVPARLVRARDAAAANLKWKSLNLIMDIPVKWNAANKEIRSQYSSWDLDEFHRDLLQSDNEEKLIHGLLSVVFWGFASSSKGRLNAPRALSRAKTILFGQKKSSPQPGDLPIEQASKFTFEIPASWTPEQALAVFDLLDEIREKNLGRL